MDIKNKLTLERRNGLKSLRLLANSLLKENLIFKDQHKHNWENKVYEKNIIKLKDIIKALNKEYDPLIIEGHVNDEIELMNKVASTNPTASFESTVIISLRKLGYELREYEIIRYSPAFSVFHDLYWIEDGFVGDLKEIALGNKPPDILGQHLNSRIKRLKLEIYPLLKNKLELKQYYESVVTSVNLINKKKYCLANILLMVTIEGLARLICKKVYQKQNPSFSDNEIETYIYQKYLSLESLIIKGDFLPDFEISLIEASILNQHVYSDELDEIEAEYKIFQAKSEWFRNRFPGELDELISLCNNAENIIDKDVFEERILAIRSKLGEGPLQIDETRRISIKPRLQFLLRSFKEDRNLIVHGKFSEFDKEWKSYLYILALDKVYRIFEEYS